MENYEKYIYKCNIKLHWKSFAINILNKYSDNKVKITQILTKT